MTPLKTKLLKTSFYTGASGKEPACQCKRRKRRGYDPLVGKIPGEGNGNPLQYSCLENLLDRGAWQAAVQMIAHARLQSK